MSKKKVFILIACVLIALALVVAFVIYKSKTCDNCTRCSSVLSCECNKKTCICDYLNDKNEIQKIKCPNRNKE